MDQTTENKAKAVKTHKIYFYLQSWKFLRFAAERNKGPLELTEHTKL